MQTPRLGQLPDRDHLAGIYPSLVDPTLQSIHIECSQVHLQDIGLDAALAMRHLHGCLTALETSRDFAMLFLAFVATARCLAFA